MENIFKEWHHPCSSLTENLKSITGRTEAVSASNTLLIRVDLCLNLSVICVCRIAQNKKPVFFFFSPQDALDYAFKRLDADISLEAQVPLSNDLMRSTAIQVIRYSSLRSLVCFKFIQGWYTCIICPGCICRVHCLCGPCWHGWHPRGEHRWLSSSTRGAKWRWLMERFTPFSRP